MTAPLARTPLYDIHRALGARIVPFAGFEMPVQYAGLVEEHHAVRNAAGLFDVSHMGQLFLRGPDALAVADHVVTNWVGDLPVGRAKYTASVNERGTILDDLIVYRLADEEVLVICNAGNRAKMAAHFAEAAEGRCAFTDESDDFALIALQGPTALAVAKAVGASDAVLASKPFSVMRTELSGREVILARTGYTGEDGVEILAPAADAAHHFQSLLDAGKAHGLAPVGLGARDTLRLEACLCLYGNDIDETTNPFEAGLGWVVKLDRDDFIGRDALREIKAKGPTRRLVGLEMTSRGIARHGYPIVHGGGAVGEVTSGSPSPTLQKNVALGYVPVALSEVGTELGVEIRSKVATCTVVKTPFYKRQ